MMHRTRKILVVLVPVLIAFIGIQGYRHSKAHVAYYNAGQPHSLNCASCHVYPQRDGLLANMLNEVYLNPLNIAVSKVGKTLFVTAQEGDALLVVNTQSKRVQSIEVGDFPHSVVLSPDEKYAYVTNQWSYTISVIDISTGQLIDTLEAGIGPAGMALSEGQLYVANTYSSDLSIIDLKSGKEVRRLPVGNRPMSVALDAATDNLYVSSRRTVPIEHREEPLTEMTVIRTDKQRVRARKYFNSAHIMENVAVTPQGDLALATFIKPKNLVPSVQIEQGWMINHGIAVLETGTRGRTAQFLLDEPNAYYSDPFDVVISNDGKTAYVSHSGENAISIVDINKIRELLENATEEDLDRYKNHLGTSHLIVRARLGTGANPKGLALSPDGNLLYVAERLEDQIGVFDTRTLKRLESIKLGGPDRITVTRKGARLFSNAGHTFHKQYSCYTCHPDGHEDGLIYDLTGTGRDLANVQTLRDLQGTSPFKWNGKNVSVYMQCGMRFSKFVTRTESFAPENLDAVVAYIMRDLTHPPNPYQNPELTPAQQRGKELYERTVTNDGRPIPAKDQCMTCHPPPNFTNRVVADVGTGVNGDRFLVFDAPNLNNIYESAPYLHDGSAATLEEIWTKFNDHDQHGYVNDMTKTQLNDLIEYLKSLGPARTYTSN